MDHPSGRSRGRRYRQETAYSGESQAKIIEFCVGWVASGGGRPDLDSVFSQMRGYLAALNRNARGDLARAALHPEFD